MRAVEAGALERLPWDESDNPDFVMDAESEAAPVSAEAWEPEPGSGSEQEKLLDQKPQLSFRIKRVRRTGKTEREQAAINMRWEKAQDRMFLEKEFLTTVLKVMANLHFQARNVILTAAQRPTASRLATQSSWRGIGVEVLEKCLKNPVWLYSEAKHAQPIKFYDITQTNGEEIYTAHQTIYNAKAVVRIAMSLLDDLKIIYKDDAEGIEFSIDPRAFIAPAGAMKNFEALFFEAIKALSQRDIVLCEERELTDRTRYIAEASAFVVCRYFDMLTQGKQVLLPDAIRSDEMDGIVNDLDCARRIARHYIETICDRLRSKKWREAK